MGDGGSGEMGNGEGGAGGGFGGDEGMGIDHEWTRMDTNGEGTVDKGGGENVTRLRW